MRSSGASWSGSSRSRAKSGAELPPDRAERRLERPVHADAGVPGNRDRGRRRSGANEDARIAARQRPLPTALPSDPSVPCSSPAPSTLISRKVGVSRMLAQRGRRRSARGFAPRPRARSDQRCAILSRVGRRIGKAGSRADCAAGRPRRVAQCCRDIPFPAQRALQGVEGVIGRAGRHGEQRREW